VLSLLGKAVDPCHESKIKKKKKNYIDVYMGLKVAESQQGLSRCSA